MALNQIEIMGRFIADPEIKRFESGTAVTTFCLAVERDFKDKSTGKRESDFINCVAYKNTAENIKQYYSKGQMAIVVGRLQIRKYQNKNGENRYVTEVIVSNIYFGESKRTQQNNSESSHEQTFEELPDDGELPF